MALMDFLTKRKAKRVEQAASAWSRYRDLFTALIRGDEVDINDSDAILEQAGKSEADLQKDIEIYQRRVDWAAQSVYGQVAAATIAAANAEIQSLDEQINALRAKLAPKYDEAVQRRRNAENLLGGSTTSVQLLRESVQDPDIIRRRAELQTERLELVQRQRELTEGINDTKASYWRTMVKSVDDRFLTPQGQIPADAIAKQKAAKQRAEYTVNLLRAETQERPLLAEAEKISLRLRELERESAEVERLALEP